VFKNLVIALLLTTGCKLSAQFSADFNKVLAASYTDSSMHSKRKVSYAFKERNAFVKYNPLSLVFGGALYFYQAAISPQIMQGCLFHPSCSNFSKQSIRTFGLIKGVALSTDRLTRCTRLAAIDCHPVMFNEQGSVNDYPDYYKLRDRQ
jgi:uncharacterized protein